MTTAYRHREPRQHPLLAVVPPPSPGEDPGPPVGADTRADSGVDISADPAIGGVAEHIALLDAASEATIRRATEQINEGLRLLAAGSAARRELGKLSPGQLRAAFVARAAARHTPGPGVTGHAAVQDVQ